MKTIQALAVLLLCSVNVFSQTRDKYEFMRNLNNSSPCSSAALQCERFFSDT